MAEKTHYNNIAEYISQFPEGTQEVLQKIKQIVLDIAPDAQEAIRYDMASFGINDNYFIHFAGWKNHVAIYGISTEGFEKELENYVQPKGTFRFMLNETIPYDLITRIIQNRVKQIKS